MYPSHTFEIARLYAHRYGLPDNWFEHPDRYVPDKINMETFVNCITLMSGTYFMAQIGEPGKEDAYPYIPSRPEEVAAFAEWALKSKKKSFLEIGSGTGRNLAVLERLMPKGKFVGIDIVPDYTKWARRVWYGIECITVDAYEFGRYQEFEVVFAWCPQRDKMADLYRHILSQLAPGTVYYELCFNPPVQIAGGDFEVKSHNTNHRGRKDYLVKK